MPYSDLPGLYAAADLAVNFPVIDAFPVTFLECLCCGLPVITNRLRSYQSNEISPYLSFLESDLIDCMARGVESAIMNLDKLKSVALKGRQIVIANFNELLTAQRLKEAYLTLLRSNNSHSH